MNSLARLPSPLVSCVSRNRVRAALGALVLGAVVLLGTSGCVAVVAAGAAGAGVAWVRGALETNLEAGLDEAYAAAQEAIAQLELAKISEKKSALDAALLARTALDKRIEIVLKRVGPKTTHVSIRVGVFGDEALSLTVLERMRAAL